MRTENKTCQLSEEEYNKNLVKEIQDSFLKRQQE